jgi:hypothetical protein
MWLLFWFQFINNDLTNYKLGQFSSELLCNSAKEEAKVLITSSTEMLYCFKAQLRG